MYFNGLFLCPRIIILLMSTEWCDIGGCPLFQFLSLRDYESCFSEREMATVFLLPKMLKHDSYEKENSISTQEGGLLWFQVRE